MAPSFIAPTPEGNSFPWRHGLHSGLFVRIGTVQDSLNCSEAPCRLVDDLAWLFPSSNGPGTAMEGAAA